VCSARARSVGNEWRCSLRSRLKVRSEILLAASTAAVLILSACAQVMESKLSEYVAEAPLGVPVNCHSSLGAYFLPKSFVKVEVKQFTEKATKKLVRNSLTNLDTVVRADTKRMFCLDYLESLLASDQVQVKKTSFRPADDATAKTRATGSQLLETVASNAVDQSALILRRLVRTAFIAISGFRDVGFEDPSASEKVVFETVADFEYDPFDQTQSAYINERLREYGFCLVLEHYTSGQPTTSAERYCNNPPVFMQRETAFGRAYVEFNTVPVAQRSPGILYRPRAMFQLHVYVKDQPKSKEPWQLRKTMPIALENVSPVLSIGVDRAAFTKKQIALIFDRGVLMNVCIVKGSEVLEALSIPLEVVSSIAKLPTEMFQIQYDQITKSAELARTETALINSQKQLIELLKNKEASDKANTDKSEPGLPKKFEITQDATLTAPTLLTAAKFAEFQAFCKNNANAKD
jgi:hypothetical protein